MRNARNPAIVRCVLVGNDPARRAVHIQQKQERNRFVDIWISRSQIDAILLQGFDLDKNQLAEIEIPVWLAEKEELDYK